MSRAFVKEDDSGEPPLIPPRAALPPGVTNYVTARGLVLLREELSELEKERAQIEANHDDEANRTRQLTIINGRLSALSGRVASARVVDTAGQPQDQVRFGATVTLRSLNGPQLGQIRQYTIVGVDEASVGDGLISFVAPIARAVTGARVGETVTLAMGRRQEKVEIVAIAYESIKE